MLPPLKHRVPYKDQRSVLPLENKRSSAREVSHTQIAYEAGVFPEKEETVYCFRLVFKYKLSETRKNELGKQIKFNFE